MNRLLRWLRNPEHIGNPDCPLIRRWTIFARPSLKLMVHHFPPDQLDLDVHDHPRPFWTFVLRGLYYDYVPCPDCDKDGSPCSTCDAIEVVLSETMKAGTFRRRRAGHAHSTMTTHEGAWTLVLMGPVRREWGFWRNGRWWPFRSYLATFGIERKCD